MAFLGNIVWFVLGGFVVGSLYLLGAIIFFPLLPFLLPMVGYSYWPFGRRPVSRDAVNAYKEANNMPIVDDGFSRASAVIKFLANFVWVFTFGLLLAITHILAGLANLAACIILITIPICLPNALAHFKLAPVALAPFGVTLVPTKLAEDIIAASAARRL
ncbi:YccF domain-containing protein [Maricaulis maris]|uniref:Uncharacterized membrane protein YccF (DUF307 family) n=1 Tax=Maricaulis maris TaxID=74318 RepID=A0A495DED2_9PROT|nr:YccF domain-containing protein [Maricaulis maris]RKR00265.1 uncharacterized membrane protein YccF (DUF307 family) [Maricaulis maris]